MNLLFELFGSLFTKVHPLDEAPRTHSPTGLNTYPSS